MRIILRSALIVAVIAGAQSPVPTFEAASINPSAGLSREELEAEKATARSSGIVTSPGALRMRDISLRECIGWAYRVNFWYQVVGAPTWSRSLSMMFSRLVASV
mgnify:CR=1 FL=1